MHRLGLMITESLATRPVPQEACPRRGSSKCGFPRGKTACTFFVPGTIYSETGRMLPGEVFPAARLEGLSGGVGAPHRDGAAAGESADAGDPHAGQAARHLHRRRRSEQELVVFATVEGELHGPPRRSGE